MKHPGQDRGSASRRSILATLTYSDYFNFPLTVEELRTRLIGVSISRRVLTHELENMIKSSTIEHTGDFYHLFGRKFLISRREELEKHAVPQLARAHALANRLGSLPGVKAIFLTGSLAVKNAPEDSDIDFMVITENNRLWTTRFLLTIYCSLFGLRRTPNSKNNSGKLCLNLFLSPISYLLSPPQRSLYSAYELLQAVPLYDPQNTRSTLLAANPWINKYLPNFRLPSSRATRPKPQNWNTGILEYCLYHLQLAYMRPKITREHITGTAAFFHPNNPGAEVTKKINEI